MGDMSDGVELAYSALAGRKTTRHQRHQAALYVAGKYRDGALTVEEALGILEMLGLDDPADHGYVEESA